MITTAKVRSVDGAFATVEVARLSACEGCHKSDAGGCSVCSLMGGSVKTTIARAKNSASASVGDLVRVESSSGRMLLYAALLFLLPLLFTGIGFAVSSALTENIVPRALSAACGFALALILALIYSKIVAKKRCDVEIIEILNKNEE